MECEAVPCFSLFGFILKDKLKRKKVCGGKGAEIKQATHSLPTSMLAAEFQIFVC